MLKKVLLAVAIILVVLVAIIASQPDDFHVTRSATIAAKPEIVFAQVNELQKWNAWSPWAKLDPNAKTTFEGPKEGVGSIMRWDGNNDVGAGSMTIIESRPNELVKFKLDFLKPMQGTNTADFTFKPEGDKTIVTWSMDGKNNFIAKAIGLIFNCDKMVGDQFEKGLNSMKTIAEAK